MDNNQLAKTKKLWYDAKQVSRKLDLLLAKLERQGERLKKDARSASAIADNKKSRN